MLLTSRPVRNTLVCAVALCALSAQATSDKPGETTPLALSRDESPLPREGSQRIVSFADIIEEVTPAVVSVFTSRVRSSSPRDQAMRNQLRRYFGLPPEAPEASPPDDEPVLSGMGSGFIVTADGYILTNNHVVQGRQNTAPDEIIVQLADGREFEATLIGGDRDSDVAVLKIDTDNLPHLTLGDSTGLRVGDIVFAVGNPLGIGLTVTQGIVSARDRSSLGILPGGLENFIQTDAAINRGNSGGPLVDGLGRVIGINAAILSSSFAGGNIGIGYAIPIDLAAEIMINLVEGREIRRGFMGVQLEPITRDLARAFGLTSTRGAVVARVNPGLPADKAGVRHGDIILTVNGNEVEAVGDLIYQISRLAPDSTAELGIIRAGQTIALPVVLGDRSSLISSARGDISPAAPRPLLRGIVAEPLSSTLREEMDLPDDLEGILIREVAADSPYRRTLQPGMVIIEINGQPINTISQAREALKGSDSYNALYLYHNGSYHYSALRQP